MIHSLIIDRSMFVLHANRPNWLLRSIAIWAECVYLQAIVR